MSTCARLISPLHGFLYGWTLFPVIETGTIAAVAVGFCPFLQRPFADDFRGPLPVSRLHLEPLRAFSTAQLLAIGVIAFLTLSNTLGLRYGKLIQNVFTVAKTGALIALILLGIVLGRNPAALHANFSHSWRTRVLIPRQESASRPSGLVHRHLPEPDWDALFSADSWQHRFRCGRSEATRAQRHARHGHRHHRGDHALHSCQCRVSRDVSPACHSKCTLRSRGNCHANAIFPGSESRSWPPPS